MKIADIFNKLLRLFTLLSTINQVGGFQMKTDPKIFRVIIAQELKLLLKTPMNNLFQKYLSVTSVLVYSSRNLVMQPKNVWHFTYRPSGPLMRVNMLSKAPISWQTKSVYLMKSCLQVPSL